jgi:regulatory protein
MGNRRRPRPDREPPDAAAAMEIAGRFLGTRPRTRWEVERRLRRAGTEEPVVEATLLRLAELGYLDDEAFARWWAEQRDRHAPRGRRMVEAELRQRGIGHQTIEAFRETWEDPDRAPGDEALPGTDEERATLALERHLRGRRLPAEPRARQRLGMFLVRRGFDPETVRSVIRTAQRQADTEVEEE